MRLNFVQDLIDRLRHKILYLPEFLRKEKIIENKKNYETIILGSSHIAPYTPDENELNAAIASQDLYSSYNMYKKLNHAGLKNIVISFSVFTPGHCLMKTTDWQMSILYKLVFRIDYEYEDIAIARRFYQKENYFAKAITKYKKNFKSVQLNKNNVAGSTKKQKIKPAKERALKHLKNNLRAKDEMYWCSKLLQDSVENNQNVFFLIPPYTSEYKSYLPESKILFEKLYKLCENYKNVQILNYYDTNIFVDSEYSDSDHLGDIAWQRFSEMIKKDVYKAAL